MLNNLTTELKSSPGWALGQTLAHDLFADAEDSHLVSGQVSTIVTVVTLAIVAIVGVLVYDNVLGSIGDPSTTDAANRTQLENSTVSVTSGFGDAMQLIPVVLLVLVASLVIAVVQRF